MTFWDQNLLELFLKGGFAMWPLLACSIVGTAIVLDKALYFLRLRLDYGRFSRELRKLLSDGDKKGAAAYCRKHANPVPRMAEHYLKNFDDDFKRNEILKREGSFALEKVESRLRGLAAVTHLAPLLGLLGTVTGLVTAFHRIEILGGQVQAGDLASGIWEALITTVFGLVIAIPCMAAYHGFESFTDRIARRMQFIISELDQFFGKRSSGNFASHSAEETEQTMRAMQ